MSLVTLLFLFSLSAAPPSDAPAPLDRTEAIDPEPIAAGTETGTEAEQPPVDEITVTAPRIFRPTDRLPFTVATTDTVGEDAASLAEDMGSVLEGLPGVAVQRTARGQSSPYLRGFTGFRTLTLIDGIRLNQAIFRDGPNQYFQLVDPWSLSSARVVGGPGSVLYGSDAVGGTLLLETTRATPAVEGYGSNGRTITRAASAEKSIAVRVESELSTRAFAVRYGSTWREFDDFHAGDHEGLQRNTAYDSWNGDIALTVPISEVLELTARVERYDQTNVPRTHSTIFGSSWRGTAPGTDLRRDFDQIRELEWIRLTARPHADRRIEVTVSRHRFWEEEDRVRSTGRNSIQGFDDIGYGASLTWFERTDLGSIAAGIDWTRENVDSEFVEYNADGSLRDLRSRGPVADDSLYETIGLFVEDEIEVADATWLTAGARLTHIRVSADDVDPDPTDATVFGPVRESFSSVVGSIRATHQPSDPWTVFGGISQAFRAPNLADLTRFDASRSGEAEIPAPGLDPEKYLTFEGGARYAADGIRASGTIWYTMIDGLIIRFPTGATDLNGDAIVTKDNAGDGFSVGLELAVDVDLTREWSVGGSIAIVDGEVEQLIAPGVEEDQTFSKLAPTRGEIHVRYVPEIDLDLDFEVRARFADQQDDLSDADKRDTQRIPPGGTPGFTLLDFRSSYRVTEDLRVFLEVENIADQDYRIHGSGNNGVGRNWVLGVDLRY